MKELVYSCPWWKNRKSSWSGTHLSLYNALSKYYKILNFDYGEKHFYNRINNMLGHIGKKDTMRMDVINYYNKKYRKKYANTPQCVFQFEECPTVVEGESYIYVDMIVGYLKNLMDINSKLFQYTGFVDRQSYISKREDMQYKFLNSNNVTILTMGKWQAKWIRENYPLNHERVYAVGGGYNINPNEINDSNKTGNKVLFIGKDFKRKNGPLVVEAFKKAKKRKKDLELYIIGPRIIENNSEDNIHFLGELTFDKIPYYFNMCDILCMPSRYEAYGLVFPEALTYGLPCIGSKMFEMPYFIEDNKTGILISGDSIDECANAIINLVDNITIKTNVRENRTYYLNEYSWDAVAARVARIIG